MTDYADLARQYDEPEREARPVRPTQAQSLVALAEPATFFRTLEGDAYTTVPVGGHRETWPVRSKGFTGWLRHRYYEQYEKPPSAQAVTDAVAELEARAQFGDMVRRVFVRVAEDEDSVYLDLADDLWRAVKVTPMGWSVIGDPPVRFRRARGMLPLPEPVRGGSLAELRVFVNVQDADWPLVQGWLVAAVRPRGPYPVLDLHGEQGSAKSTTARVIRALVDPSTAPLRGTPRDERDLMIAAANSWVLAFDNVSWLPSWLSDALCRLATGGGLSTRQLYTDQDEIIFAGQRPIILNGIGEYVVGSDLRDRVLTCTCPPIGEADRRDEDRFWKAFDAVRPRLLGALLDAVSMALRNVPTTALTRMPRMADFARWVVAAEPALGGRSGTFLSTYADNRRRSVEQGLEFDSVAQAVRQLVEERPWDGTFGKLLERLRGLVADHVRDGREWPQNAKALSNRLHRLAPNLRQVGVLVEFGNRVGKGHPVTIRKDPQATFTMFTTDTTASLPGFSGEHRGEGRHDPESTFTPAFTPKAPPRLDGDDGEHGERATHTLSERAPDGAAARELGARAAMREGA